MNVESEKSIIRESTILCFIAVVVGGFFFLYICDMLNTSKDANARSRHSVSAEIIRKAEKDIWEQRRSINIDDMVEGKSCDLYSNISGQFRLHIETLYSGIHKLPSLMITKSGKNIVIFEESEISSYIIEAIKSQPEVLINFEYDSTNGTYSFGSSFAVLPIESIKSVKTID